MTGINHVGLISLVTWYLPQRQSVEGKGEIRSSEEFTDIGTLLD